MLQHLDSSQFSNSSSAFPTLWPEDRYCPCLFQVKPNGTNLRLLPWLSHQSNSLSQHQVESHIRKKLDSLLKEAKIGDKEDTDSFSIRALLRATHEGIHRNLGKVTRHNSTTVGIYCTVGSGTLSKRVPAVHSIRQAHHH